MRRLVSFSCDGRRLAATVDEAAGSVGLLILSGGNEIRAGAHRGMAKLAADVAVAGFPVFRFDRRGIGDSEGENCGFEASALDIDSAIASFRDQFPAMKQIVAFGNCDAASAILLHRPQGIAAALLANIWTIEATANEGPPPAAIRARYKEKLLQPREWIRLISGGVDLIKLAKGLSRVAVPVDSASLSLSIAKGLEQFEGPVEIILCSRDATAIAFMDEFQKPHFQEARARSDMNIVQLDSASHSFTSVQDYEVLKSISLRLLNSTEPHP